MDKFYENETKEDEILVSDPIKGQSGDTILTPKIRGQYLVFEPNGDATIGNYAGGQGIFWDQSAGTLTINGGLTVDSIDIPDTITTSSFHVDTSGNTWWGATTLSGSTASVSSAGTGSFQAITISGAQTNIVVRAASEREYTAGERIEANASVFLEDVAVDLSKLDINNAGTLGDSQVGRASPNPQKAAQIFNESSSFRVSKIKVFVKKTGTPTDNFKIGIQTSSGSNPSGTFLASATLGGGSITTSYVEYTFTLDTEIDITASTEYAVVAERSGSLDDSNYYNIRYETTSDVYTGGIAVSLTGAGPTWNGLLRDWDLELLLTTVAGQVYNSSARTTAESNAFIGFAKATANGTAAVNIMLDSEVSGFTGLTIGTQYYLSNTFGTIATSAGSNTRKVGIATSATTILITNLW